MVAKTALGAKLFMGASGGALTALANLLSITPPKVTRDTIDASDLDTTGGMEYIAAGLYDGGTLSATLHYVAGDTTDDALVAAAKDGVIRDFKIQAKAATGTEDLTFPGFVTEYGPNDFTVDGKQTSSLTVKVSGDVAQAATP